MYAVIGSVLCHYKMLKVSLRRFSVTFTRRISPIQLYDQRVEAGRLRSDPYQREIITSLSVLHECLNSYKPPKVETPSLEDLTPRSGLGKLFGSILHKLSFKEPDTEELLNNDNEVKGIYLYGDVGCGKTMLMDLFYDTIPEHIPKKRLHFHQFMQHLHKRSHQLKQEHHSELDVIPLLASEIAQDSTVLCFDEFQVTDVADAMLLRRLMMLLLSPDHGVVLFATSNRAPDDLYLNGIQRKLFVPCIKLIKKQTRVIYLNSPTDYRKIPRPVSSVYKYPKPGVKYDSKTFKASRENHIRDWYEYFNKENDDKVILENYKLTVWGRELIVPKCSHPYVAQFTFEQLCGNPLAAGDYLTLATSFQSFIITDIPYLSTDVRDKVRRFITFLDAVYDNHDRIAVTSAASFNDIFVEPEDVKSGNFLIYKREINQGKVETFEDDELVTKHGFDKKIAKKASMFANDEEKFAFARALSRLSQMSTTDWIESVRPIK